MIELSEGGVEEGRVVVGWRGTALLGVTVAWEDRRLVVMETSDVITHAGHQVLPARTDGKGPANTPPQSLSTQNTKYTHL